MSSRPGQAALAGLFALACGGGGESTERVTIPVGASMSVAAESLHRTGIIGSPRAFRLYARVRGSDRGIQAGTYLLKPSTSWEGVLTALRSGKGVVNVVTVPEGFTLRQTEALLTAELSVPPESIAVAVRDTALLRRLDVPIADLEGYLFPDTYFFPPGTSARAAVYAMIRRFEQRWKTEWGARLDTLALSRHKLITLASIVEREAKLSRERPLIAAVYWNRLRRGMRLEADPTVQYALPQYQSRLLFKHLNVKSPYNTYRNAGLPPGPIGAPGVASLEAALYPADVAFLYFVAFPDGHHEFRSRLQDHQVAARAARRAWLALERMPPERSTTQTKRPAAAGGAGG